MDVNGCQWGLMCWCHIITPKWVDPRGLGFHYMQWQGIDFQARVSQNTPPFSKFTPPFSALQSPFWAHLTWPTVRQQHSASGRPPTYSWAKFLKTPKEGNMCPRSLQRTGLLTIFRIPFGGFLKWEVPSNHPFIDRWISIINHKPSILEYLHLWKPPIWG
jgi:hypothetical protein